jgi:hypothetical protein
VKLLVQPGQGQDPGRDHRRLAGRRDAGRICAGDEARIGLNKILGTVHAYPTMSEANKYAAGEWKKARKPERMLAWAERWHKWRRG